MLWIKKQPLVLIMTVILHGIAFSNPENRAVLYPLRHSGTLTNPYESLVIGNGDMAVSTQIFSHELVMKLGKNDIWDSRIESFTEDAALKHDELIRLNGEVRELPQNRNRALTSSDYILKSRVGPTPKPAGLIRLRHPGLSNTKIETQVDISSGIHTVNYGFRQGHLLAEVFADLVEQHIPVFEHLAKTIFDLDGVYVDLMTAPFAPPNRAKTHSIYGRALAHTGWVAKMLFDYYDYTGDTKWLARRAYPFIKKAAIFYSNYLDKYQKKDGDYRKR